MDEMTPQPMPAVTHSKIHTWIIILLSWLIVLVMAAIGILIVRDGKTDSSEIAAACQNATINGVNQGLDTIADACLAALDEGKAQEPTEAPSKETEKVSASATVPGLSYPADWTAFMMDVTYENRSAFMLFLDPEFVFVCEGCDGPQVPITIRTEVKDPVVAQDYGSYKQYFTKIYSQVDGYSNVTSSEKTLTNGTSMTYSGRSNGLGGPSDFETIYFEGATWIVSVNFSETDDGPEYDDVWNALKASLDFSLIQ